MKIINSTLQKKYGKAKFSAGKVDLPYYKEGVTILSPGTWNETRISELACKNSFNDTEFDTKNSSLFLNHEENAVEKWVGYIRKIRLDEDTHQWIGDLEVLDEETALKLENDAPLGISPTIGITESLLDPLNGEMVIDRFELKAFSIVVTPAMDTNYINEPAPVSGLPFNKQDETSTEAKMSKKEFSDEKEEKEEVKSEEPAAEPEKKEEEETKEGEEKKEVEPEKKEVEAPTADDKEQVTIVDVPALCEALGSLASSHEDSEVKELAKKLAEKLDGKAQSMSLKVDKNAKKVQFQKELEAAREEMKDTLGKLETAAAKLNEHQALLNEKDLLIGKLQKEIQAHKAEVGKYEEAQKAKEAEKRSAWFNDIFNRYCDFHEVAPTQRSEAESRLKSMSDDALTMIDADIQKATFSAEKVENDETHHSAQLNEKAPDAPREVSKGERMDELFGKLQNNC